MLVLLYTFTFMLSTLKSIVVSVPVIPALWMLLGGHNYSDIFKCRPIHYSIAILLQDPNPLTDCLHPGSQVPAYLTHPLRNQWNAPVMPSQGC